ncbi:Alpha/Beta hydrolase protein [Rhypophila decipiens]|uniref:Alpha/Beta hydrolase protein n=1 Tax=Rhypophila decipiens TaxID=261697 RepID=A0AAN7BBV0_9PEZI|nr:Alpha/Beta hydrolase protein [Rhypophila decipiens]
MWPNILRSFRGDSIPLVITSALPLAAFIILLSSIPGNEALANPLLPHDNQHPILPNPNNNDAILSSKITTRDGVSVPFFASLERMARLVDIAYCVGTTGISRPFSCASRCKDFPTLTLTRTWNTGILMSDSCGYIAVDHGKGTNGQGGDVFDEGEPAIIVAFRGTYSITNTIVDLSTIPQEYVPYPAPPDDDGDGKRNGTECRNCTVHMGFLASWRNAREVVIPALKEAREKHPGYPVHLVGHSLGGAVAALAALELRLSLGWSDIVVTTFGEPRIGNQELVRYLDEAFGLTDGGSKEKMDYRRVTHVDDPVPLLPLSEWGFRSHAGEVFISKTDLPPDLEDLRLCDEDRDPKCSNGAEEGDAEGDWFSGLLRRKRWRWKWGQSDEDDDVEEEEEDELSRVMVRGFPTRLKLWQLLFAHRDYFWRLGLCVPGGDPADWGRGPYNMSMVPSFEVKEDL